MNQGNNPDMERHFSNDLSKAKIGMDEITKGIYDEICIIIKDAFSNFEGFPADAMLLNLIQDFIRNKYKLIMVQRKMRHKQIGYVANVVEFYECGFIFFIHDTKIVLGKMDDYEYC